MAGENIFEVKNINMTGETYVVNIDAKECSCRMWMLTGIPCTHAISCMNSRKIKPEDHIPMYYRKTMYSLVYGHVIYPANGEKLWLRTEFPDVIPPPIRKQPGRPKKNRRKDQNEVEDEKAKGRMSKKGLKQKCRICGKTGHNRTTCPDASHSTATPQANADQPDATQPPPPSQSTQGTQPDATANPPSPPTTVSQRAKLPTRSTRK